MLNLANAVRQLKMERDQAQRRLEQLTAALKVLGDLGGVSRRLGGGQTAGKKRRHMSGRCPETNRRGSTRTLGEMEGNQT